MAPSCQRVNVCGFYEIRHLECDYVNVGKRMTFSIMGPVAIQTPGAWT